MPQTGSGSCCNKHRPRGGEECANFPSSSPQPGSSDSAAAFSLAKALFCILGFLSIIDGSIVKTLPDPGMCVEGKKKINNGSFNPCFCLHS